MAGFHCRRKQPGAGDLETAADFRRNAGLTQLHRHYLGRGYRFVAEVKERPAKFRRHGCYYNSRSRQGCSCIPHAADTAATTEFADSPIPPFAVSDAQRRLPAKTGWLWVTGFLAVAILSIAVLFVVRHRAPNSFAGADTAKSAPTPVKSIAVLPFENLSDEKQNAYFTAGVQDEITSNLARIADLKVISRTSANLYRAETRGTHVRLGSSWVSPTFWKETSNESETGSELMRNSSTRTPTHMSGRKPIIGMWPTSSQFKVKSPSDRRAVGAFRISPAEKRAIQRPPTTDLTAFDLYARAKSLSPPAFFSNAGQKDLLEAIDL